MDPATLVLTLAVYPPRSGAPGPDGTIGTLAAVLSILCVVVLVVVLSRLDLERPPGSKVDLRASRRALAEELALEGAAHRERAPRAPTPGKVVVVLLEPDADVQRVLRLILASHRARVIEIGPAHDAQETIVVTKARSLES